MTPPFASAEDAWMWCYQCLTARRDNAPLGAEKQHACEPDDIVLVLDRLYRHRRITLTHARVLRVWGEKKRPPDPTISAEQQDARTWAEALSLLTYPLRVKGIVA